MDEAEGMRGGSEGDIRSLEYWSRMSLIFLVISVGIWAFAGAWNIYQGMTWLERDRLIGSTQATSDLVTGVALCVVAGATVLLARLVYLDIHQVFAQRRFQVPREKLLVYGILGLPFGFVISGSLLLFVNIKLSHPDFLPSHAEAYPDAMPGFVQVPRAMLTAEVPVGEVEEPLLPEGAPTELAPLGFDAIPVTEEEAQPAPEFFGDAPVPAGPYEPLPQEVPEPAALVPPPTEPAPAMVEALVEEVPEDEIPEVVAEVTPAPAAPVEAVYEEVEPEVAEAPVEAVVEAVVEEVPEDESGFELVEEPAPEDAEGPQSIEEAHEDLLDKLLGK
ncbi:MAG: hypothetical protein JSW25_04095 [Thermoplasmata archaeon]|nr:MAG: hypothetical protein JSW25_04095 [Thermoplasmata archaeon]